MKLGTIADLIAYRLSNERLVTPVAHSGIHHPSFGEWQLIIYRDAVEGAEHIVLIKGDLTKSTPVLVFVHSADQVNDVILARDGQGLHGAMFKIMRRGRGAIVLINDARREALSERVGNRSPHSRPERELREYGLGAQILVDIGVKEMIILSNRERTLVGIEGYGLAVAGQELM